MCRPTVEIRQGGTRLLYTDAVETKSLIWFVASILHSLIFTKTMKLREKERSAYSMPEVFAKLHRVWCYKNVRSGKYIRLRKLTDKQKKIFQELKISEAEIDEEIAKL